MKILHLHMDSESGGIYFLGYARIPLEALYFDHPLAREEHREVDHKNTTRLLGIFRKTGCKNDLPQHSIAVTVPEESLRDALEEIRLEGLPREVEGVSPPNLNVARVKCL